MSKKNPTAYELKGYIDRADYLQSVAIDYGVDIEVVKDVADMYGPSEDFDGLLVSLTGGW